ncbi:cyclase family protein [soil metagenome]
MNTLIIRNNDKSFQINLSEPLDISIPLRFNGVQPNAYGAEKARAKACEAGSLIGDTRYGGSCNFEQIKLIPHCNGTHTECIGHITNQRISITDCLKDVFIPTAIISVEPETMLESEETYPFELKKNDQLITQTAIKKGLNRIKNEAFQPSNNLESIVIRTLPNSEGKLNASYLDEIPPFFTNEAMKHIAELKINHLLVDLPSIDRIFDNGKLSNHRIFWNVEPGSFEINANSKLNNTVTELIYVKNEIADGYYLLNLQIAPFVADATPSRPVLFKLIN